MNKEVYVDYVHKDSQTIGTYSMEGKSLTTIRVPKPEDTKVSIWGYELCNGAEWQDFLDIVNKLGEEKTDLEAKLAESEKKFIVANNLRKNSDEVLLNYKTEKYGLDKTIQELRKMKLSLPEKEWYYKGFENCERQMSSNIADLTLEVKGLKQQLAEKEAILDWQNEIVEGVKQEEELLAQKLKSLGVDCIEDLGKHHNQAKIELLKRLKSWCEENCDTFDDKIDGEKGKVIGLDKVLFIADMPLFDYIDTLIKEIKGELYGA